MYLPDNESACPWSMWALGCVCLWCVGLGMCVPLVCGHWCVGIGVWALVCGHWCVGIGVWALVCVDLRVCRHLGVWS